MASDTSRKHGGLDAHEVRALGIDPAAVLDLSVNLNPYGPTPLMVEAIRRAPIDRYPDPEERAAREALAAMTAHAVGGIAIGNGATELLWTLARVLFRAGDVALIVEPTFAEFRAAATAAGACVREWRARAERSFAVDLDAVLAEALRERAQVVSLCVPNSPTGATVRASGLERLATALSGSLVLVDESFLSLGDDAADLAVVLPDNVVRVRSLTKDHAIPAVRAGYVLCAPSLRAQIEAARPAWTTSAASQAAIVAACRELDFVAGSRRRLAADRAELIARLARLGRAAVPSAAPFVLLPVADAALLRRALLTRHRVLVRDCASFGLPGFIRVAARPAPEIERLLDGLRDCASRGDAGW